MRELKYWIGAAAMALLLALAPMTGHARSLEEALSKPTPTLIATWYRLNDDCLGAQIDPDTNPTCKARDWVSGELERRGYALQYPLEHWAATRTPHANH